MKHSSIGQATCDFAGDFDIEELAGVLFDYDAHMDTYVEREYTDAEIQTCGVTSWQDTCVLTDDGSIMLYERWDPFTWENHDGHVSLTLSTVRDGGDSMWEPTSRTVADTDRPLPNA